MQHYLWPRWSFAAFHKHPAEFAMHSATSLPGAFFKDLLITKLQLKHYIEEVKARSYTYTSIIAGNRC